MRHYLSPSKVSLRSTFVTSLVVNISPPTTRLVVIHFEDGAQVRGIIKVLLYSVMIANCSKFYYVQGLDIRIQCGLCGRLNSIDT